MAPPRAKHPREHDAMAPPPRAKRRRGNNTPLPPTLPGDLVLEIVARSDPVALVRCAASCKLLRRDILTPSFIHHRAAAPYKILAYLCTNSEEPFTLIHPANPATQSFCHNHLFPFFLRRAAALFHRYSVMMTSRRGHLLLRRVNIRSRTNSIMSRPNFQRRSDLCVYDPMSGTRTFLPCPPEAHINTIDHCRKHVLLTAADGIGCPFLLVVLDIYRWSIKVHAASSSCAGIWRPLTHERKSKNHDDFQWGSVERQRDPVVLRGGVMHWLAYDDKQIVSYDLGMGKLGFLKLPHTNRHVNQLHIATSSDGKLLKLLAIEGFMMSIWQQASGSGSSGWSLEAVIDMEEKLRLLHPEIPPSIPDKFIIFDYSKMMTSCEVVFLQVPGPGYHYEVIVFDLETEDMHTQKQGSLLLEIDLLSRLQNMKIFS